MGRRAAARRIVIRADGLARSIQGKPNKSESREEQQEPEADKSDTAKPPAKAEAKPEPAKEPKPESEPKESDKPKDDEPPKKTRNRRILRYRARGRLRSSPIDKDRKLAELRHLREWRGSLSSSHAASIHRVSQALDR